MEFKTLTLVVIEGRRWFQRSYGNTYNSVRVHVEGIRPDGKEFTHTVRLRAAYGYGDDYRQRADDWLAEHGYLVDVRQRRVPLRVTVRQVRRKKDLHTPSD